VGVVVCAMAGAAISVAITVPAAIIRLDLRMLMNTPKNMRQDAISK
jgi:hypothetical protein